MHSALGTLESGINVAPGKIDIKNKRSPLKCANLCSKIQVFDKNVAPGKNIPKLKSVWVCLFWTLEYFFWNSQQ